MNTPNRIVITSRSSIVRIFLALLLCGVTVPSFAQLQWSSYDTSGNLVTANVAIGGAANGGGSVTFTIPANTQLSFVTKNFLPFSLTGANARRSVTFNVSASGGLAGISQRTMGWGLFNSAGSAGFTDDVGYFGLWTGALIETYDHPAGTANLFGILSSPSNKLGQGTAASGTLANSIVYTNQILLVMNNAVTGISLGTSSSTLPNAGLAINGPGGVAHRVFTNPVIPLLGTNSFDEFAFMFNNTTGSPVTATLSEISLVNDMTWDASGSNPTAPTDGSGNWSITNANWSTKGSSDNVWSPGYNAVIGAGNGAAGTITVTNPLTVSNMTFNAAGSGSYNITGSTLLLTGTPTITVASGVTATNSSALGGTGFTKAGSGMFVLAPTVAATNVGTTTVNAGSLLLASTTVNSLNDNVVVNPGAVLYPAGSVSINPSATLTINGAVTNLGLGGTSTETHNLVVFDNNGVLAYGPAGSGQLNATNFDFRSGLEAWPKFPATMTTNFSVKSTSGTMAVQSRPNNTGVQGLILTVLAGTMILDYPNPAPNGDSTQGGAKLLPTGPLTLGGGTLFGRFNAGASRTETVLNTRVLSGATSFQMTNNAANGNGAYSIVQNAINRSVGGTLDYSIGGTSTGGKTITTTTINANGILGGWATWAGSGWAVGSPSGSATAVSAYSAYTISTDPTTWAPTNNVSLSGSTSPDVGDGTNINSLRLTAASTVTLDGTLTLTSGGLLVSGTDPTVITGGTLEGASGTDLVVQHYGSAALTISSTLADNTSASSLTKSGPGKLIITGTNNLTGTNFLNGGVVEVSDLAQLASGPLVMNNGALRYTGSDVSSTRGITLNGIGGTIDVSGSATVTQTTAILSGGGATSTPVNGVFLNLGDWGGLTKVGNGTLVLAANNIYNGPTVVSNGVLRVNGIQSLTGTSPLTNYSGGGTFTVYGGTLGGNGTIAGLATIKNGGTISPGASIGTLTLANGLTLESGSTSLFEVTNGASGDLLAVQGNLTIGTNATLAISVLGSALDAATNTLITYTGTKSGSFNPTVVVTGGSLNSSLSIDESTPGQINLIARPQVAITGQPQDIIASTNDPVTFTVTATGASPLSYQWYRYADIAGGSPTNLTGETGTSFTIASAQGSDSGFYGVVVNNSFNSVTSRVATLIVGNVLPVLFGPTNTTVIAGNSVTFNTVVGLANPAPTLQWQTNGVDVAGATSTSLTLNGVPSAYDGMSVSVIANNAAGSVTNFATLTVIVTPVITPQPTDQTVNVGDTAVFTSGATGVPIPTLQWYKGNTALSGETGSTLTIANAQGANIAFYKLVASNTAGSVTSSVVKLTVNSTTLASTALAPANGATGIGYDTPLYITFNGPISIVNSGKIRIYNSTNQITPVDTIDMSSNVVVVSGGINLTNNIQPHSLFSGDPQVINYFPVIITGNTAAIYPHGGVMTSNQTYYVTVDSGIVTDSTGAYFAGISDTNAWRFTTKPTGPVDPNNLIVAADGTGDFVTVQGAVDSVPPGNTAYRVINIHDGNYVEIVDISGKSNITFRGQSRLGTVVGYPNNNNLTGTTAARMAFKVNAADIKLERLTLTNGTPQGGSQAETLLIYNSGLRCVVNNCDIVSRQDTVLINAQTSQGYFNNCRIVGNFDYVWGVGVGYFNNCVFHTLTNTLSGSYNLTAARTFTSTSLSATTPWVNPNGTTFSAYGFTFVGCTVEADNGVTGITLAGSNGTAGGLDSWVNCLIDTNAYVSPSTTLSNTYVFWQNNNQEITGTAAISYTNVQTIGITNNDPRLLASTNPVVWFSGWLPALPNNTPSLTPVSDQTVNVGVTVNVTNVVTDPDVPAQTITFSLLSGPGSVDPVTGVFTWRPAVINSGTTSGIQIAATDNGSPNLSATNSFSVIVNPLTAPTVSDPSFADGQFTLTVSGQVGPDYALQMTTDLSSGIWTTLMITNSPPSPFTFTNPAAGTDPMQFYRVKTGPPLP